jgi:chloramphenicol O-acetyltransferase type A
LTSIEHPVLKYKSVDIPSVAWGKFTLDFQDQLIVPMAVQAHHGFVDGFHITQFANELKIRIEKFIK